MTTELTKAAQQAHTPEHIAGVDHAHELLRRMGYHRDGDWFIHANRRGAEAIHTSTISTIVNAGQLVITQRPAAQEVRSVKVRITDDPDVAEILRPAAPTAQQLESAAKVCDGFAAPDMAAALRGQRPAAQEVASYFSYGEDAGYLEHATAEAAREQAKADIRGYRNDAMHDNEWPSEVDSVCWGVVLQKATAVDNSEEAGQESFDYELGPATQQATPEPLTWAPLKRSADGRAAVLKFFMFKLKRHDFLDYITNTLAADFACVLGGYLQAMNTAATPVETEPVGEAALLVAEILSLADDYAEAEAKAGGLAGCGGDIGEQHELDEDAAYIKGRLTDAVGQLADISTRPAPGVPDAEDLRDRLVAISSAVADSDDRAAQSMLSETLRLLAAAAQAKGGAE